MNDRIEVLKCEDLGKFGFNGAIVILRDIQTGVLYMHSRIATSGGLTPLINQDGKPLVLRMCKGCGFSLTEGMTICPECGCSIDF